MQVELVLDRGAGVSGFGGVRRLASRCRGRGCTGGPRAAAVPRAVAGAISADGLIGREVGALGSGEEREGIVGKGVDGSIMDGSIGRPLESLVGEGEMAARVGLIIGEMIVKVDGALLISALRIPGIEIPKDKGLSMLLLDVGGDFVVDTPIRGAV